MLLIVFYHINKINNTMDGIIVLLDNIDFKTKTNRYAWHFDAVLIKSTSVRAIVFTIGRGVMIFSLKDTWKYRS
ncbi:hypothetical protein GCM10011482_06930 [Enterococcus alcedinis]|uniref:Uncharacterized protein n=1 Tax=Enterococcus alcedinis TaxID=1274384 RepID=A0A917JGT4_9ENTE|nr:hypothetical protein GCM10011482_06930 [Enterococcus alcedinis]